MTRRQSVMVSIQTKKRLHALKKQIEEILDGNKISEEQVLQILLAVKHPEEAVMDLMME